MLYVPRYLRQVFPLSLHTQIVVYAVVIFAFWVIPGFRVVLNPLKLLTIGWHELCHITMVRPVCWLDNRSSPEQHVPRPSSPAGPS